MRDLRSLAEQGTPETLPSADGTTTLHRHFVGAVIYAPSAHEAARRLDQAALYLEAGEILPHDPRVGGERDVYVVRPDDTASDAAVFMREPEAEAFRATFGGEAGDVERCLTANAETAHRMIVERIDDMERDEFVEGYVSAACWANLIGTGEDAESGSDPGEYGTDNLDPLELTAIRDMCSAWIDTNARALALYVEEIPNVPDGTPWERAGHDLWLTRNGHGAGYGDRGVSTGDELAEAARKLGEASPPMLNEDGTVNMAEDTAATIERVDGRDDAAVSARWQLIADADLSEVANLIERYGKAES